MAVVATGSGVSCSTAVPAKSVCRAWRLVSYGASSVAGAAALRTGMLSPVSELSLTIAVPLRSSRSAGSSHPPALSLTTSPGTSCVESASVHAPSRLSATLVLYAVRAAILRWFARVIATLAAPATSTIELSAAATTRYLDDGQTQRDRRAWLRAAHAFGCSVR